ncbi:BnaAnng05250D [Brassica napus]|uniref:BnaAnng05250D protein n=1 Tax=Brassica napus TaxID=3708 RepID=A0A078HPR5_BRANA|nr:BnaAnng05250D [Brassica napus]
MTKMVMIKEDNNNNSKAPNVVLVRSLS